MQSEDAAEPVEWDITELKRNIAEWEEIAFQMMQLLPESAEVPAARNWQPHLHQIQHAVGQFRDRCRAESTQLGRWRPDGLQASEVYDLVWAEADRLVKWLTRMMEIDAARPA
jgi:hypothetical protein